MSDRPTIDISGLDKAEVLAALYNASAPAGMGFFQASHGPKEMTVEDAQQLIEAGNAATPDYQGAQLPGRSPLYFDYLYGRPLKLNLTDDKFDPWGFDRDNGGPGTAQKIIDKLRATKDVNPPESQEANATATELNAHSAMEYANTVSRREGDTFFMGGSDIGAHLEKAVDAELNRQRDN